MAITLGELLIKLTAKTDAFQKGMSDAKRLAFDSSSDIVSSLGRIGESLAKLKFENLNQVAASLSRIGGIIAGVSVGVATAAIAAAEHVAQQAKEIDKLSQSYGLSVQQISAFRVASQITGVSLDTITSGMSRLAKNAATVAEAVGGHTQKGAAAAFNALHISVTDSQGKLLPLNDLLGTIAEKFSRMQDSTTKTALAIQIFGKGGAALIPFLNEGKEGLERLRQVSDELGLTWTQSDITAAKEFAEKIELLKLKGEAFEEQLSKGLYPALNNIVTAFTKVDSSGNSVAHTLGDGLGQVLKNLAESAAVLGHDFATIYLTLKELSEIEAKPSNLFNKEFLRDYEEQLKSLDQQLKATYATLEKTNHDILSTFPAAGGDVAGRLSALKSLFGNKGSGDTPDLSNFDAFNSKLEAIKSKILEVGSAAKLETARLISDYAAALEKSGQRLAKIQEDLASAAKLFGVRDASALAVLAASNKEAAKIVSEARTAMADVVKAKDAEIEQADKKILELSQQITKELRDQHALKDFPVNLSQFAIAVPNQSTFNTSRDAFNADRLKKFTDSVKDTNNILALQASIFDATATSSDRYNFELEKLGVALKARVIDQETFNRAVTQLGRISDSALKGAKAFFQDYADAAKETGRQVYDALSNAFDGINNNLAEMIVKGKADWKSLLDDIETSLVKIGLQKLEGKLITTIGKALGIDLGSGKPTGASGDPIHTIVDNSNDLGSIGGGSQDSSGGGGGGLLGSLFGGLLGLFSGGGATSGAASDPGFFSGGQRADGGPVSAGVLYRVNERGRDAREYFKPNVSGHVIPLGQMSAAGGGFTFAPTYYITTPNADTFRKSQHQLITEGLDSANRAQRRR